LALLLFKAPTRERLDTRHEYHERRMQAIGTVGGMILHCVYTDRGSVRRIISLRRANRKERDDHRKAFHG
jgi:uncharacterized DUF497 family protein